METPKQDDSSQTPADLLVYIYYSIQQVNEVPKVDEECKTVEVQVLELC